MNGWERTDCDLCEEESPASWSYGIASFSSYCNWQNIQAINKKEHASIKKLKLEQRCDCNCWTYLSCPSRVLVFLLRRAILDLWVVLRAGPTLMDVFSKGVAEIDTLLPLCKIKQKLNLQDTCNVKTLRSIRFVTVPSEWVPQLLCAPVHGLALH